MRLPHAASTAPSVPHHKPKPESLTPYSQAYSGIMPSVPHHKPKPESSTPYSQLYSGIMPHIQITNPLVQNFHNSTFNFNNGHSSNYGPPFSSKGHKSSGHHSGYKSHTSSEKHGANSGRPAYTGHHHTHMPTTRPSKSATYPTHHKALAPPPKKPQVHFPESVSNREREREKKKQQHPASGHRTNHASKSGERREAVKVERLMCEFCQVKDQAWLEVGSGLRLCEGCYRFREGKRAGGGH